MDTHHPTMTDDPRIAQLIESVEQQFAASAARADQTVAALERLVATVGKLATPSEGTNGSLDSVLQYTSEAMEEARRVRQIVATQAELAHTQVDAISSIDERLESLDQEVRLSREERRKPDEATDRIDQMQRKVARALNVIRDLLLKQQQESRNVLAGMKDLTDALTRRQQELQSHVTKQADRIASKGGGAATWFSAIAALAAIGAVVATLLK
ncbi:MAG: hypothetical protein O7B26_08100 [Planctomycetota bacterium]|nr:hypothetical protein [Planctomycetota bacterium]